jgi:hypothetical protein
MTGDWRLETGDWRLELAIFYCGISKDVDIGKYSRFRMPAVQAGISDFGFNVV